MSEDSAYIKISKSPQAILSVVQLIILLLTLVWLGAFLRADVDSNKKELQVQKERIEAVRQRSVDTYVRRDVFNEQYRQIIERLDALNEKLEE